MAVACIIIYIGGSLVLRRSPPRSESNQLVLQKSMGLARGHEALTANCSDLAVQKVGYCNRSCMLRFYGATTHPCFEMNQLEVFLFSALSVDVSCRVKEDLEALYSCGRWGAITLAPALSFHNMVKWVGNASTHKCQGTCTVDAMVCALTVEFLLEKFIDR